MRLRESGVDRLRERHLGDGGLGHLCWRSVAVDRDARVDVGHARISRLGVRRLVVGQPLLLGGDDRVRVGVDVVEDLVRRRGVEFVGALTDVGREVLRLLGHLGEEGVALAARAQPGLVARDRVAGDPGLQLGVEAVLGRVVGRRVRADPVGERLDQARAVAGTRFVEVLGGDRVAREHIVAVDLNTGDAESARALIQRYARLHAHRHRDRPVIVLDEEHLRRLVARGEDEGLVHVALAHGTVTEVDDDRLILVRVAHGVSVEGDAHGVAGGMQRVRTDHEGVEVEVLRLLRVPAAVGGAAEQGHDVEHVDPADHGDRVLAVGREDVVLGTGGVRGADLRALLARRSAPRDPSAPAAAGSSPRGRSVG